MKMISWSIVDIDDTINCEGTEEQPTGSDVDDELWQPYVANFSNLIDSGINRTVKFAALNICGVLSKSTFPEFTDFVIRFDIICLVETKLDQFDTLHVNNFEILSLSRNSKKGFRHGGIAMLTF